MTIRPELPGDYHGIAAVVEAAFGRPNEARLVEEIRAPRCYLPELALVAEEDGAVVGHIMISYVTLKSDAVERDVLSLAPVSVAPGRQGQGIGSALIREAIARADVGGAPLIVVLGHPGYYPRFGFERARPLGIEPPSPDIPDAAFMVRRLSRYDATWQGRIVYPAFYEATGTL